MERRPLLLLGMSAAAGAALTQPLDGIIRILLFAAVAIAFLIAALQPAKLEPFRLLAAFALAAGAASGTIQNALLMHVPIRAHTIRVACTVLDVGQTDEGLSSYTCAADGGPTIAVQGFGSVPRVGEHVMIRGRIESFDGPRNPGEPDQAQIERERGMDLRMSGAHVLARAAAGPGDACDRARTRARVGIRATAFKDCGTVRFDRRGRTVGRAHHAAAGIAHGVSRNGNRPHSGDRRAALGRDRICRARGAARAHGAARTGLRARAYCDLGIRGV